MLKSRQVSIFRREEGWKVNETFPSSCQTILFIDFFKDIWFILLKNNDLEWTKAYMYLTYYTYIICTILYLFIFYLVTFDSMRTETLCPT